MTERIKVFKIAGHWVWSCSNGHGGTVGEEYANVRDPWCVASQRAQQHADMYHGLTEGETIGRIGWAGDDDD